MRLGCDAKAAGVYTWRLLAVGGNAANGTLALGPVRPGGAWQ